MATVRLAFIILLLVNIGLFVWGQGHLGARDAGREPERLAQQLAPDKLRILPPADLSPAGEAAKATEATTAPQ